MTLLRIASDRSEGDAMHPCRIEVYKFADSLRWNEEGVILPLSALQPLIMLLLHDEIGRIFTHRHGADTLRRSQLVAMADSVLVASIEAIRAK